MSNFFAWPRPKSPVQTLTTRFGAKVVAFCDRMKFLCESIKDCEIAGQEKIFSSEDEKLHPEFVDMPYVAPKIDRVPKKLIDIIVTEEGSERRKDDTNLPSKVSGSRVKIY